MSNQNRKSDIGLIGLAVMGENLVMNMESKGYTVSVFNRSIEKVTNFVNGRAKGLNIVGAYSLEELVGQLKTPRIVMLMVRAGQPVDDFITALLPLMDKGDIIIDGGNSHFPDTERRWNQVEEAGLYYIGTGVSGGEEGALLGPAVMPGGSPAAWPIVKPILQAISAKVGPNNDIPCCQWVGRGGAGHYVKMIHNGIEYGDMQLICEVYQFMRDGLGMTNEEMHDTFAKWNEGKLDSYLIEITRDILAQKDEEGNYVVDLVLDRAGQKGTGKWTGIDALEHGIPLTLIIDAVLARSLSSLKDERIEASKYLVGPNRKVADPPADILDSLHNALYASKIVSYAQGFSLLRAASEEYDWDLNYGNIAMMWRGGCIIRSAFLDNIKDAFVADPNLPNLLLNKYFHDEVAACQDGWRTTLALAVKSGIPTPSMSAALSWYDGYRCANLPANLLQAQRDYFGAHTYERVDKPRGEYFHTNWGGQGGQTSATTYTV